MMAQMKTDFLKMPKLYFQPESKSGSKAAQACWKKPLVSCLLMSCCKLLKIGKKGGFVWLSNIDKLKEISFK